MLVIFSGNKLFEQAEELLNNILNFFDDWTPPKTSHKTTSFKKSNVTSQFSISLLYIDHHMHIILILAFGWDPRNLKQLKDPRRELEVSQKNKWEKIIWLLQIKRNIGERILKSNYDFSGTLFAILFELEKICIFENCILGQKNVHLVQNIPFRWRKLFLAFLDFFFLFY